MKFLINASIITLITLSTLSCDKVTLKPKPEVIGVPELRIQKGQYILDGKGGIFNNLKWYEYSLENHLIWTFFDVYIIKTENDIYKIQFLSYFGNGSDEAGTYRVKIESKSERKEQVLIVPAVACGNPYTNTDYENCIKDPERNVFTYLNLKDLSYKSLTDVAGLEDTSWDIAFRGTDIKLNSGTAGPKKVVGALAKRFDFFFDSTTRRPISENLRNRELQQTAINGFSNVSLDVDYSYYLRDGMDRVIHESEWLVESSEGTRDVDASLWWVIKEHTNNSFVKINFAGLDDSLNETTFETTLEINYYRQGEEDSEFSQTLEKTFFTFTQANRTLSQCFNFKNEESYVCSRDRNDWDLKLVLVNVLRSGTWTRDWRLFTNTGAWGPLSQDDINQIQNGRRGL